jgi:hypothetical protein
MPTVTYSPEAKAQILKHVLAEVSTGRSVARVLREDDGMPSPAAFWVWHFDDPQFQDDLGRARSLGQEALLDEVHEIVDDATGDVYVEHDKDGNATAKIDGQTVARARLRAEYRVKMAQMLSPKKYGNKLDLTSGGEKLPAPAAGESKVEALLALGVHRVLDKRMKQLPAPEEKDNDPFE